MKSFKKLAIGIIAALIFAIMGIGFIHSDAHATVNICTQSNVSNEIRAANGCGGTGVEISSLGDVIINIVKGVVAVFGFVAVIFIVVGGVNYMTSMGDATKLEKAKKTILYAVIGLIISALAFAIVNFVIARAINAGGGDTETTIEEPEED